jgi:hypothetical protein
MVWPCFDASLSTKPIGSSPSCEVAKSSLTTACRVAAPCDQHALATLVSPPPERALTSDSNHETRQGDQRARKESIDEDDEKGTRVAVR